MLIISAVMVMVNNSRWMDSTWVQSESAEQRCDEIKRAFDDRGYPVQTHRAWVSSITVQDAVLGDTTEVPK